MSLRSHRSARTGHASSLSAISVRTLRPHEIDSAERTCFCNDGRMELPILTSSSKTHCFSCSSSIDLS